MNYEKDLPVSDKKQIVIKDACILFDLVDLNLLKNFFQLEVIALTTPQVIGEITNEDQWKEVSKFIEGGQLQIDSDGEFGAIQELYDEFSGLSLPDCSVLELAIRKDAIVYSSDGSLRKISIKRNLIVRGVLWIVEEVYTKGLITKEIAFETLLKYQSINQRAPLKEIEKLMAKLNENQLLF